MRRRDTVELIGIGMAAGGAVLLRPWLPAALPLGEIALTASALLLGQGLLRDLWIKYSRAKRGAPACAVGPERKGACMCMESTLGMFGIVAGAAVLLGGVRRTVALPGWFWPVLVLAVGGLGFLLKNLVIDWKARRLRIEKNHDEVHF